MNEQPSVLCGGAPGAPGRTQPKTFDSKMSPFPDCRLLLHLKHLEFENKNIFRKRTGFFFLLEKSWLHLSVMTPQPSERDDQGWAQAQTEQGRHSGLNPGLTGDASGPGVSITPSLAPSPFAFFSSAPNLILFILSIGVFVGFTVRFLYALGFVCVYLCAEVCGGHMNMCVHGGMEVRGQPEASSSGATQLCYWDVVSWEPGSSQLGYTVWPRRPRTYLPVFFFQKPRIQTCVPTLGCFVVSFCFS